MGSADSAWGAQGQPAVPDALLNGREPDPRPDFREALTALVEDREVKPFLVSIAIVALAALPAAADTLPEQVRSEAARLLVQVDAAGTAANAKAGLKPAALAPMLVGDLQRFAVAASRLSLEIDQRGGPTDLRCIFRGMAEDTDAQLKAASAATTGTAQSMALSRLSHTLKDAVTIAPAVGGGSAAQTKTAANVKSAAAGKCEAVRDF